MLGLKRTCKQPSKDGQPCRATPQRESDFCFWHDPENAREAAEARRLGGIRRRREGVLQGTYDLGSLDTVAGLRRLLEIAAADALALDNSANKARVLVAIVQAGAKLLETGELEARIEAIESVMDTRSTRRAS